jgi:hypothetical protein
MQTVLSANRTQLLRIRLDTMGVYALYTFDSLVARDLNCLASSRSGAERTYKHFVRSENGTMLNY